MRIWANPLKPSRCVLTLIRTLTSGLPVNQTKRVNIPLGAFPVSMKASAIRRQPQARFRRTADRKSAVPLHPTVTPHSSSLKEVLVVIRVAASVPVKVTVTFPEVSYAFSVKVPEYEFPFGLNVTFSVS